MEILYILIPLSIILLTVAVYLLGWAIKSGQFDDLEGPPHRILFDDDEKMIPDYRGKKDGEVSIENAKQKNENPE